MKKTHVLKVRVTEALHDFYKKFAAERFKGNASKAYTLALDEFMDRRRRRGCEPAGRDGSAEDPAPGADPTE